MEQKQMTDSERLRLLEYQNKEIKDAITKINDALFGNTDGEHGLRSDVRMITESLKTLNGNLSPFFGENGFAVRLSKLEKSVEEHHASVADLQKRSTARWQWIISSGIAIAAVVIAWLK